MIKGTFIFLSIFVIFLLIPLQASALNDLTITPWRIVFQTRDRSAAIDLLNTSNRGNTYRLSWILMKATPKGGYEMVPYERDKDKDPHSVANMVILSPRQVTIEPHGEQLIRLSLRRPPDLPPGEYRAHLTLTRLAHLDPPVNDPNAKSITMSLKVNVGFSVPVIVRQGEDNALKVALSHPALKAEGNGAILELDLSRIAGKFSSYGTVHVFWKSPKGDKIEVGTLNNVALYPEVTTRHIVVPLLKKYSYSGGDMHVVYAGALESEGTTWAENTFSIGK
jgi:fimbrial chaperone protein